MLFFLKKFAPEVITSFFFFFFTAGKWRLLNLVLSNWMSLDIRSKLLDYGMHMFI